MDQKGPKGYPILGVAPLYAKDGLGFLTKTAKDFPKLAKFKFAHWHVNLLSDPSYIKYVLQENNKNYYKGKKYSELKHFLGNGLVTSEGDFWRNQRRLSQPSFSREKIAGFMETMIEYTDVCIDKIRSSYKDGEAFDFSEEMMEVTLGIVGETLLSKNLAVDSKELGEAITFLIEEGNDRIRSAYNFPMWAPLPKHLKFKKSKQYIDGVLFGVIEERRKNPDVKHSDLLEMLMETEDLDTGEKMSDLQLRDEITTMVFAGHETTALALTWAIHLISDHPEVELKLIEETKRVTGGKALKMEHIPQLSYALQVLEETLRLFPPAWIVARRALTDDVIDGHKISKNDNIFISPYVMGRSEVYWENPEKFDPERFTKEKKKDIHKYVYFPFGGGPRLCIGNHFAIMEMQIILTKLYQNFKFKKKEGFQPIPDPLVTLRSKNGMWMTI